MGLYDSELYLEDIKKVADCKIPWDTFNGKTVAMSGATGLIGSFLIDVFMFKKSQGLDINIYGLGRNREKFYSRFSKWIGDSGLFYTPFEASQPLVADNIGKADYVLHLASNTHPIQYATDPIGTITTNIIGLKTMLDFAVDHGAERFVFASSNEIYGENRGDTELFDESYCGYIDSNTMRAGYPESKRCGEALCQAYMVQKGLDVVVPRFTRSYGPTVLYDDSKAINQFISNALKGEDIILKSAGTQNYSYTYMADAVSGLLYIIMSGESGMAYNIADETSNITLKELARMIAGHVGRTVVFDIPDELEASGYSKATKALLDGSRLRDLGWRPLYDMQNGIERTLDIMTTMDQAFQV